MENRGTGQTRPSASFVARKVAASRLTAATYYTRRENETLLAVGGVSGKEERGNIQAKEREKKRDRILTVPQISTCHRPVSRRSVLCWIPTSSKISNTGSYFAFHGLISLQH